MTINQLRLFTLPLLGLITYSKNYDLLYYLGAMQLSLEFLNRQTTYLHLEKHRIFNLIFWLYLFFTLLNRTRTTAFSSFTEGVINGLEHGFFAFIICFKILIYLKLFTKIRNILLPIVLIFNALGVVNEVFQNQLNHRSPFIFIADSQKDLIVNTIGSLLFIGIAQWLLPNILGKKV